MLHTHREASEGCARVSRGWKPSSSHHRLHGCSDKQKCVTSKGCLILRLSVHGKTNQNCITNQNYGEQQGQIKLREPRRK